MTDIVTVDTRPLARGRARMRELAAQAEQERLAEQEALLADLGHSPSHAERLLIVECSALAVRARRLRSQGRDREAADVSRLLLRAIGRLGVRQGSAMTETIGEYLERTSREASQTASPSHGAREPSGTASDAQAASQRTSDSPNGFPGGAE